MAKQLLSEKEIKKRLQIKSFKNLPAEKQEDLAKLLIKTKKDVAIGIINQLPDYITHTSMMLQELTGVCQNIIDGGKKAHTDTIEGYMVVLDSLEKQLQRKFLTARRKEKITNQMLDIADKIANEGGKHRTFLLDCFKGIGAVGIALATVVVSVVNISKK